MEHLKVKAAATTTDKGEFSALAAAYTVDRMNERIVPGAFEKTLEAWRESGKMLPLHWDHESGAENVIGYLDPAKAEETLDGLYVEGHVDIDKSDVAAEAWRSMKNNAVSLSFGYLPKTRKAKDGVTEITEIDLFEVSIVPAPANPDTKLLSLKSVEGSREVRSIEDVQTFLDENFPGHTISAVEDGKDEEPTEAKSPQDPLVKEAWDLLIGTPKPKPQSTPEPEPESLDTDAVSREAWARLLQ